MALILATRSRSICCLTSRASLVTCESLVPVSLGRLRRFPSISSTATPSGFRPSTALATRLETATTFCGEILAPVLKLHHDARFGRLLLIEKDGLFREAEVNSCLNDLGHAHDRPFELTFECALIVDVFDQFGSAEICLVEELESDSAGFRKPGGRECEPGIRETRRWNHARLRRFRPTGIRRPTPSASGPPAPHLPEPSPM